MKNTMRIKIETISKRLFFACAVMGVGFFVFTQFYMIGLNLTNSLPGTLFLIDKSQMPHRGDLVGFRYKGFKDYYPSGTIFVKIISGEEGDIASVTNSHCLEYHVNGVSYGCIKATTSLGKALHVGPVGVIPKNHLAVRGLHKDSFDSRYGEVGWIKEAEILGKAIRVF